MQVHNFTLAPRARDSLIGRPVRVWRAKAPECDVRELVAAMFSSEFVEGGIDPDVLRRVHAGEHEGG
jgi:hypothetical protein